MSKPEIDALLEQQELTGEIRAEQLDVPTLVKLGNRVCAAVNGDTTMPTRKKGAGNKGERNETEQTGEATEAK